MISSEFLIPLAIAFCIAIYASIYVRGIYKGNVKPVLATWVLFAFAAVLSFVTDFAETGAQGIRANFFNLADTCAIFAILGIILRREDMRRSFTLFEKCCIGASVLIALAWFISKQNIFAHISIQVILFIAYIPTLTHLWTSSINTESFWMWFFDFLASFLGLIEPLRTRSLLPTIYTGRAVVCTFLVLVFMMRLHWKQKI